MKIPEFNPVSVFHLIKDIQREACENSICPDVTCDECVFHQDNYEEFLKWLEEGFPKILALEKENKDGC